MLLHGLFITARRTDISTFRSVYQVSFFTCEFASLTVDVEHYAFVSIAVLICMCKLSTLLIVKFPENLS